MGTWPRFVWNGPPSPGFTLTAQRGASHESRQRLICRVLFQVDWRMCEFPYRGTTSRRLRLPTSAFVAWFSAGDEIKEEEKKQEGTWGEFRAVDDSQYQTHC